MVVVVAVSDGGRLMVIVAALSGAGGLVTVVLGMVGVVVGWRWSSSSLNEAGTRGSHRRHRRWMRLGWVWTPSSLSSPGGRYRQVLWRLGVAGEGEARRPLLLGKAGSIAVVGQGWSWN